MIIGSIGEVSTQGLDHHWKHEVYELFKRPGLIRPLQKLPDLPLVQFIQTALVPKREVAESEQREDCHMVLHRKWEYERGVDDA